MLQNYITDPRLSYSRIKSILKLGKKEDNIGLRIGTIVDQKLTGEEETYNIYNMPKFTPQEVLFLDTLFEESTDPDEFDIARVHSKLNIKRRSVEDLKVLYEKNKSYFEYLANKDTTISDVDYSRAVKAYEKVVNSKYYYLFNECELQREVYTDTSKIKLDMVKFEDGKIYPYDLKTTSDRTYNFINAYKDFRYDIQSAFYSRTLQEAFPQFEVRPFRFIVASTVHDDDVLEFIDDTDKTAVNLEIDKAMSIYKYCRENNLEVSKISYFAHKYENSIPLTDLL